MKWFNRLCYLVATEICMVRRKLGDMTQHSQSLQGSGGDHLEGNQKGILSLSVSKPRIKLGTSLE